jgi:hypothetical protein
MNDDDTEDLITDLILDLLMDAREQGVELLSFEEICLMLGVDDLSLMTEMESTNNFVINTDYIDKLQDPEVRKAMIESFKATKH